MDIVNAVGRRKDAIARVFITKGKGNITVNNKPYKEYFAVSHINLTIDEPIRILEIEGQYDVNVRVTGGGIKGQAEAVRLGIARALVEINAEFRGQLKGRKMLTRDPRVVERKKPGKPKARKSTQFSKR